MNPLAIGSNFTKVKETKGKVKKMLEITKLTEFDESAIRATVLGEIYRMVEETPAVTTSSAVSTTVSKR